MYAQEIELQFRQSPDTLAFLRNSNVLREANGEDANGEADNESDEAALTDRMEKISKLEMEYLEQKSHSQTCKDYFSSFCKNNARLRELAHSVFQSKKVLQHYPDGMTNGIIFCRSENLNELSICNRS